ncbi:hypothetical protein Ocin01_12370 [Orchesella cincta]|uniref:Uncharacterized protein n=1 Tax=Orchesella cincta TaxID=48709 RepID=A0A1D2MMM2_ORCCI|nr:hypothetical protein Ocin01_12370 [Orchesella cincta]
MLIWKLGVETVPLLYFNFVVLAFINQVGEEIREPHQLGGEETVQVETLGPLSDEAKDLTNSIGSQLIQQTRDTRAKHYLFQRISLAIQRGNVISIMGTLPPSISMEEIFYL